MPPDFEPITLSPVAPVGTNSIGAAVDQNLALCERTGHRPELALTRAHLAELLLDNYPDERAEAVEHLDFAIREFQDMKMTPSLEPGAEAPEAA